MTQAISMGQPGGPQAAPGDLPELARKPSLLGVGVMVWLGSELMFFSGLFAAYFTIRAHDTVNGVWPPKGIELDTLQSGIFTVILVLSSFTMQKGVWDFEAGKRTAAKRWVWLTLAMGGAFLGNQIYEWLTLPFHASTNAYGSMFYIMTGLHGLHVFVGLAAMLLLLARMAGPKGDPGELPVFQSLSYYWHFVDIVWVGLYASLFLLH